jgi:hypothetical protein
MNQLKHQSRRRWRPRLGPAISSTLIFIFTALAAASSQGQLTDYSFENRIQMSVDDFEDNQKGIKLVMKVEKKGHLEILPMHLDLRIKCKGQENYQVIDMVSLLQQAGPQVADHYRDLFSTITTRDYPNGQFRFCAFESLNFDQTHIMLKVLKGRSGGGCEQSYTVDLEVPISRYCPR